MVVICSQNVSLKCELQQYPTDDESKIRCDLLAKCIFEM